jgi:stearoyl-CoA desaturase (delta-9 desaturase)
MNWTHRPSLGLLVFIFFVLGVAIAFYEGPSLWWAAAYGVHFFIFTFGVAFGLHRVIAHQAAEPPKWLLRFAAMIGVLAQGGSPVSWRTVHLLHHTHADLENDPHSPKNMGWRVMLGLTQVPSKENLIESLLSARSLRDPFLIFLHRYYYLVTALYLIAVSIIFGFHGLLYLAVLPIGLSFTSLGLLNYFAHASGQSRNVVWLWPLTFGENWHHNHHQKPSSPSARVRPYQLDLIFFYFLFK